MTIATIPRTAPLSRPSPSVLTDRQRCWRSMSTLVRSVSDGKIRRDVAGGDYQASKCSRA